MRSKNSLRQLIATVGDEPSDRELAELVRFSVELFDTVQHHIVDEEDQLLRVGDSQLSRDSVPRAIRLEEDKKRPVL